MINVGNREQEGEVVEGLDDLTKIIEESDFIEPKKKAILSLLQSAKKKTKRHKECYRSDEKIKKILRRVLIAMVVIGLALMVGEGILNILPSWITDVYGYILVIFIIIAILFTQNQ